MPIGQELITHVQITSITELETAAGCEPRPGPDVEETGQLLGLTCGQQRQVGHEDVGEVDEHLHRSGQLDGVHAVLKVRQRLPDTDP